MSLRAVFFLVAVLPAATSSAAAPALDLAGLSSDVAACTDFDRYVNGKWHASTPIPADKARIGSFDGLRDASRRIVEDALNEAVRQPERLDTPGKRLAAEYYASGMDLPAIEKRGLMSLAPLLSQIDALNDRSQPPGVAGAPWRCIEFRRRFLFRCVPMTRTSAVTLPCSINRGSACPIATITFVTMPAR